jgi:hypothetical protein
MFGRNIKNHKSNYPENCSSCKNYLIKITTPVKLQYIDCIEKKTSTVHTGSIKKMTGTKHICTREQIAKWLPLYTGSSTKISANIMYTRLITKMTTATMSYEHNNITASTVTFEIRK